MAIWRSARESGKKDRFKKRDCAGRWSGMTPSTQTWPRPSQPRPIVIVGAGGIVQTAHLPAYRATGLPVAGIFDIRREAALGAAAAFAVPRVYDSLAQACAARDVVYDVAV